MVNAPKVGGDQDQRRGFDAEFGGGVPVRLRGGLPAAYRVDGQVAADVAGEACPVQHGLHGLDAAVGQRRGREARGVQAP